jgi:hypothetical protein
MEINLDYCNGFAVEGFMETFYVGRLCEEWGTRRDQKSSLVNFMWVALNLLVKSTNKGDGISCGLP